MMKGFSHIVCHSHFSFMRGVSSVSELCARAAELGMDALALTDVNGVYGSVFFWRTAREHGLWPLLGADVRADDGRRAVLIAQTPAGYGRMCRILTDRHLEPDFNLATALADRDGLAALIDDPALLAEVSRSSGPTGLYAMIDHGPRGRSLLAKARACKVPPVATADVYFARPDGAELQRLARAVDLNTTLARVPDSELAPAGAFLCSGSEIRRRFPHCEEAVDNAARLALECRMEDPPWRGILFPSFKGLDEVESYRLLRSMCLSGARQRYGKVDSRVRSRLDYELSVIRAKRFSTYFLVVEDIVRGFPITCGRGSAAASLVSYCLFITHVDPIRHHLFFERFLNPGRQDPPDIDVDFPWDTRDDVLDYVFKKYGRRNAAMVANHVSLKGRGSVREVAKVYGLPEMEIKRVTGRMRKLWSTRNARELVRTHPMFKGLELAPPWPTILDLAHALEGMPRNLSVHCGGVVIAPGALDSRVPLETAPKGVEIIQWEKDQTEDAGLVKIDLLGNRSLAVIRDSLAAIGHEPFASYRKLNPVDDPATQNLVARGDTVGVFYVESPSIRQLQKKAQKGDFEHLVIHSSIIRPAANDYIREYLRRLKGGAYEPLHPLVDEILSETHGIMCYQEDVCKTAMALAGFDAVDGDGLRKVLSKKHRQKKLREYKERFFEGASARGVDHAVIEKAWEMIMSFAGYSFCKPHSASYALVSFKSAWLRAHHPAEFMAAVISNQGGYYHAFAYISEARRMGIEVRGPDVNQSEVPYTGHGSWLRVGLMQIKGLTAAAAALVVTERARGAYRSFGDFMARTGLPPGDVKLLVKAGCFDELEGADARPALLWRAIGHRANRAATLFEPANSELPRPPGYDDKTLLRHEVETLGFLVSRHPLELYLPFVKPLSYVQGKDLAKWVGRRVTAIGWYVTGKLVETKDQEPMEFLSFEDTTALYETVFFPRTYRLFCHMIDRERPFVLEGRVEEEFGVVTLNVDRVRVLEGSRQ